MQNRGRSRPKREETGGNQDRVPQYDQAPDGTEKNPGGRSGGPEGGPAVRQDGPAFALTGGDRGDAARLFVYRTKKGGFENLGLLDVNRSPYYAWLAFEIDSMVTGPDGTIFIGESSRISHLYLLYPW